MTEYFCENATSAEVDINNNGEKITIVFSALPIAVDLIPGSTEDSGYWIVRARFNGNVYLSWSGRSDDLWYTTTDISYDVGQRHANFNFWKKSYNDSDYIYLGDVQIFTYIQGEFTADFDANYTVEFQDSRIARWVFSDSDGNAYDYPDNNLTYKIKCDGCEPGDCKATKEKHPGYVCMDCKDLQSRLTRIKNKLNESNRR